MDRMDITPFLTNDQYDNMLQMIQSPPEEQNQPEEHPIRSTRPKRSLSPEIERPRRNLRPRLTRPSYAVSDPDDDDFNFDSDSDSSENAPSMATQPNKNTPNQSTITSDTNSSKTGPSLTSQTSGNVTNEPLTTSDPVPPPDDPQTKTGTGEPGIIPKAEDEPKLLSIDAEIASLKARLANLEDQRMDTLFITNMSDTKDPEATLMAELTDAIKKSDEDLYGMLKKADDRITKLSESMAEVLGMLMKRSIRFVELIDRNESGKFYISDPKNREDALAAALVDANRLSEVDLYGTKERLDRHITEVTKKAEFMFEGLRGRREEIKELIDRNVRKQIMIPDGDDEARTVQENDGGNDGDYEDDEDKPDSVNYDYEDGLDVYYEDTDEEDIYDTKTFIAGF